MNYNNSDFNRLLKTFQLEIPDRVPILEFWPNSQEIIEYVIERPLGYTIDSAIEGETGSIKIKDAIEFSSRIGMDAIGTDFVYWPGQKFEKSSNGAIHYSDGIIKGRDDLCYLEKPKAYVSMLENFESSLEECGGTNIGVYPRISAFFNPAYLAMGLADFSYALYDNPEFVTYLMDSILEAQIEVMEKICAHDDVKFIQIDDDIAIGSGLIIGKDMFYELYYERMKTFLKPAKDRDILIAYHTDGKLDEILPIFIDLGIHAIHPVEPMSNDICKIKKEYGHKICLCGNIDLVLISSGSRKEIADEVKKHLSALKEGGGYVCGTSSSLYDGIPPENYAELVKTVQEEGYY